MSKYSNRRLVMDRREDERVSATHSLISAIGDVLPTAPLRDLYEAVPDWAWAEPYRTVAHDLGIVLSVRAQYWTSRWNAEVPCIQRWAYLQMFGWVATSQFWRQRWLERSPKPEHRCFLNSAAPWGELPFLPWYGAPQPDERLRQAIVGLDDLPLNGRFAEHEARTVKNENIAPISANAFNETLDAFLKRARVHYLDRWRDNGLTWGSCVGPRPPEGTACCREDGQISFQGLATDTVAARRISA